MGRPSLLRNHGTCHLCRGKRISDSDYDELLEHNFTLQVTLDKYPKLKNLMDRVKEIPNIKKWLAERPVTQM